MKNQNNMGPLTGWNPAMCPLETMGEPFQSLYESLLALEKQTGISQEMARARDVSSMLFEFDEVLPAITPVAPPNEYHNNIKQATEDIDKSSERIKKTLEVLKMNNDQYLEYMKKADLAYHMTRDAYFSVQDMEHRKNLIAALRKINSLHAALANETQMWLDSRKMTRLEKAVSVAVEKTIHQPWTEAAALAVGAVAVGNIVLGYEGGIAGAVAGIFLGMGYVTKNKIAADVELKQATDKLEQTRKIMAQRHARPDTFSGIEEITGKRDVNLDLEVSPHASYYRSHCAVP